MCQTGFRLDVQKEQRICFTRASAAPSVTQFTPALLAQAAEILPAGASSSAPKPLILADNEH